MKLSRVMVVDDSEADQFMCQVIFKEYNPDIEILQAYDGVEALEILESSEKKPEAIFLDINMPRMNGFEFLEKYSTEENKNTSVVVMLTSSSQEKDKERAELCENVKCYLEKPLSIENMQKVADLTKSC